jgi:HEAT repeat protein
MVKHRFRIFRCACSGAKNLHTVAVTPKRKYWLFGLAAAALAIGLLIVLLTRDTEPRYQGKSLSHWVDLALEPGQKSTAKNRAAAREAIKSIGTNAIPTLMQWLQQDTEESWMTSQLKALLENFPINSLREWSRKPIHTRRVDAANAFLVLGEAGRPAIPELKKILYDVHATEQKRNLAAWVLGGVGCAATPALTDCLTNTESPSRVFAAEQLAECKKPHDENVAAVVPLLVRCLHDKDQEVVRRVVIALNLRAGHCQPMPELVVPALAIQLRALPDDGARMCAMVALRYYGPKARIAVPALLPYTTNSSGALRDMAIEAIKKIAPEALTNAPAS